MMKTAVGYCVLLLASLITLIGCEFEPLEPTAPTSPPVTPVYYVFSLNGTVHTVCAVISGGRSMDLVLQPTAHTNGTFLVNGAERMSPFRFHFRNENGDVTFVLRHIRSSCHSTSSIECDQLVISPSASAIDFRGAFKLQYIPEFTDIPVNLTFEYSPPAIFFDGNSTVLGQFGRNDSLTFKLRFTTSPQTQPSVCEIHANGTETTSTTFGSLIPKPDVSCITPSGSGSRITTSIQVVGLRDERNGVISPGLRRVFLTEGTCENNTMVAPLRSEPINVTVVLGGVTTTAAPTTMESNSAAPTTEPPPVEAGFPLYAIILICVCVILVLILGASVGVSCLCYYNRKSRANNSNTGFEMPEIENDQKDDKGDEKSNIKAGSDAIHEDRQHNTYVRFHIEPPVTDSTVTAESSTDTTVSGLIFITDGEAENYKNLEEKLLSQHCCKRIHPVVIPLDSSTPSWDQRWRSIASRLKSEKEYCLVYVIWSGSLETTNGNHDPPIRKVIQSLDRPLRKNTPSRESVNHRLVFLQLGSKGTAEKLKADNYIKVFWPDSVDDRNFDAEECGSHVYEVVNNLLVEHEQQVERERQVKNNESKNSKSFVDGIGEGKPPLKEETFITSDDKPVTKGQLKETFQSLIGVLNESKDEVIKHVDNVGQQVEYVADKYDDQNIQFQN